VPALPFFASSFAHEQFFSKFGFLLIFGLEKVYVNDFLPLCDNKGSKGLTRGVVTGAYSFGFK